MNLRSLLQDIINEVSSRIISFQIELHLLITWARSSSYFKFKESLRTCIMASQLFVVFVHYWWGASLKAISDLLLDNGYQFI